MGGRVIGRPFSRELQKDREFGLALAGFDPLECKTFAGM
jgi:hypothetical protein